MLITALGIFALIIGSFLTACIYRIPLGRGYDDWEDEGGEEQDQTLEKEPHPDAAINLVNPPRSFCPKCREQLRWWHNIPLFSWLMLGGKCWYCKTPIPMRYPLVELITLMLALLCWYRFGVSPTGFVIFAFCCSLIVISFIDYDYYIIPNVISLPGTAIGVGIGLLNQFFHFFTPPVAGDLMGSLLGILAGAGSLWLVAELYMLLRRKEGMGMGDVKLLAMTGALLGWEGAVFTIWIGASLGAVLGVILLLLRGHKLSHQLPFGPYLATGTLLYLFARDEMALLVMKVMGIN